MKHHRNDRSQSQHGDQRKNQQGNQRDQREQRAAQPGISGRDAAARSEQRLDREERSLVGDTAEDRNVTGSTTYVTLPEQQGDERPRRDQRNASGSQQSSDRSANPRSANPRSASPGSTRSRSTNDRDTPR